jgi:hypothetical protein
MPKFNVYEGQFICHECKGTVPTARFWTKEYLLSWKCKCGNVNKDVWSKVVTDTLKSDREKNPALIIVLGEGNDIVRLAIIEQEVLEQLDDNDPDMV